MYVDTNSDTAFIKFAWRGLYCTQDRDHKYNISNPPPLAAPGQWNAIKVIFLMDVQYSTVQWGGKYSNCTCTLTNHFFIKGIHNLRLADYSGLSM